MSEETRGMEAKELEKVLDFVSSLMGGTREYFEAAWRLAPGALPEHSRLYMADGRIASHMHLYFRKMRLGPARITVGQIGEVCTDPAFRKRGFGTALLEDSAEYFRSRGVPFSVIISGVFGFYYHGGYQSFPLKRYVIDLSKAPEHKELRGTGYSVRRAMREIDLPQVAACYMEYNRRRPLTIVRDLEYWRRQFWTVRGETEDGFLVAEKEGRIVAYCRMGHDTVLETASIPGHSAALRSLLGAAVQLARKRGLDNLALHIPEDDPLLDTVKTFAEEEEYLTTLVKVVDLSRLLTDTAVGLNHLMEKPLFRELDGWKVGFHLDGKAGALVFRSSGVEGVEGIPKDTAEVLDLDHLGLAELLCGRTIPGEGATAERLRNLFSGKAPYFWPLDLV